MKKVKNLKLIKPSNFHRGPPKVDDPTRPKCPQCNSPNPMSKGNNWVCGKCGRQWVKIRRGRKTISDSSRPVCPECNEPNPMSESPNWKCRKCGRSWVKISRTEVRNKMYSELLDSRTQIVDI